MIDNTILEGILCSSTSVYVSKTLSTKEAMVAKSSKVNIRGGQGKTYRQSGTPWHSDVPSSTKRAVHATLEGLGRGLTISPHIRTDSWLALIIGESEHAGLRTPRSHRIWRGPCNDGGKRPTWGAFAPDGELTQQGPTEGPNINAL